jgi:glucose/arabinose dehydrogenase
MHNMQQQGVAMYRLIYLLCLFCTGQVLASDVPLVYEQQQVRVAGGRFQVSVPQGYVFELLTTVPDKPRLLTFAPEGELLIGSRSGRVYRSVPPYTSAEVLVELDDYPHSVAVRKGEILIAQTNGLYRADYRPGQPRLHSRQVELLAALPGGAGHNSRTIRIGPDQRVYLSLGIRGNCSNEYLGGDYAFDNRRGGVLVLDESGEKPVWRTHASGLRNPVGFDWHPQSGEMYASNNGPDHWGFEMPPEYFSHLLPGSFHGMPWFQFDGKQLQRDACISEPPPRPMQEVSKPVATFPARNAPMGVAFVPTDSQFDDVQYDGVVALRGSWGTRPSGGAFGDPASRREPKLVLVRFKGSEVRRVDDFVTGFQLADGSRWARPVGVAFGPDGALYFTSDSGVDGLYRLRKRQP